MTVAVAYQVEEEGLFQIDLSCQYDIEAII